MMCPIIFLLIAAMSGPLMRKRAIELWTVVPLAFAFSALIHERTNPLAAEMPSSGADEADESSGMCTLSAISSDDTATPFPPPPTLQPAAVLSPLFHPWPVVAALQQPPAQGEVVRRDSIEAWKRSVYQVSCRKAKHDVPTQEYASLRAAARNDTSLLSRLPRELHKVIGWHVVRARSEEEATRRVQAMATRVQWLYPDAYIQAILRY